MSSSKATLNLELENAVKNNNYPKVQELITQGVDLNHVDWEGMTPLMLAAESGYTDLVEVLLKNNAAVDFADTNTDVPGYDSDTALIHASRYGHIKSIKMLLENGANINLVNKHGDSALMYAVANNRTKSIEILLENNADTSIENNWHHTALMSAAYCGHEDAIEILLKKDVDINGANKKGITALMIASEREQQGAVTMLLENGANIKAVDKDGKTALKSASDKGFTKVVELLKEAQLKESNLLFSFIMQHSNSILAGTGLLISVAIVATVLNLSATAVIAGVITVAGAATCVGLLTGNLSFFTSSKELATPLDGNQSETPETGVPHCH